MVNRVISILKENNVIDVWMEEDESYVHYMVTPNKTIPLQTFPKKDYTNYEHFAGVVGKFKPYTLFLVAPINVEDHSYKTLDAAYTYLISEDIVKKFNPYHDELGRFTSGTSQFKRIMPGGSGVAEPAHPAHSPKEKPLHEQPFWGKPLEPIRPKIGEGEETFEAFHGTVQGQTLESILQQGLIPNQHRNWDKDFYTGKRKGKVFVTANPGVAAIYAREAAYIRKETPVVLEAHIPKEFFEKQGEKDTRAAAGWMVPYVKKEWIKKAYRISAQNEILDEIDLEELKEKQEREEGGVIVYVPLTEEVLKQILKEKKPKES